MRRRGRERWGRTSAAASGLNASPRTAAFKKSVDKSAAGTYCKSDTSKNRSLGVLLLRLTERSDPHYLTRIIPA